MAFALEECSMTTDPPLEGPQDSKGSLVVEEHPDALKRHLSLKRMAGQRIGVVPTMGALHAGHQSLMKFARAECDVVVATIFVNPLQFGPKEDFERYPRPLERDLESCRDAGVDYVFHPTRDILYPHGFDTTVEVGTLSNLWEGAHRPGHFRGVTTVVLKLLNITFADVAYFGLKDYQQQAIIRRMCMDLNVPTEIRSLPTVREADGLAMSSRNQYLSREERESALALWQSLSLARERLLAGESNLDAIKSEMRSLLESTPFVAVDYATIADPDSLVELSKPRPRMVVLIAARVGKTRLIDNLLVEFERY
jgi:pantoate--beta-alanine ligase